MELEDLKAAWQREKADYPWDEDPKEKPKGGMQN